jgi:glucan 1,3-beta-glucosidase
MLSLFFCRHEGAGTLQVRWARAKHASDCSQRKVTTTMHGGQTREAVHPPGPAMHARTMQGALLTPLALLLLSLGIIATAWAWLGTPVQLVRAPIDPDDKLQCISYAPFRDNQTSLSPATRVTREQIAEDLAQLAKVSDCIRTYATDLGLDQIPGLAAEAGLKVVQGIFLDRDQEKNRTQIATAIRLSQQYPQTIIALVVGNETLLRKDITVPDLIATLRAVKAQASVPVTYADVWEFWLANRELHDAVDFVTIHILPYWENEPVRAELAAAHVDEIRRRVAAAFPGKEILIGEIGWPSEGRMREAALPSRVNQARVVSEILDIARREKFRVNVFEAYDEGWKRAVEGTVGGSWGLFDSDQRALKYPAGIPISNFPSWKLQMGCGLALAIMVFAAAWLTSRRKPDDAGLLAWIAVGLSATTAGLLLGVTAQRMVEQSYGAGLWLLWGSLLAAAAAAPILGAIALISGRPLPSFLELLGPEGYRSASPLTTLQGLVWIVIVVIGTATAIGLVFDPRFIDFPFAPLTMAAVPFAATALLNPTGKDVHPLAESIFAGVFAGAAIYVGINEGPANWQSLWTCAAYLLLALTLWRVRV